MSKNPFEKFADKLLHRDKKSQDLKKYNIDLSSVLGEGIDNDELIYNEHRKLVGIAKTCLSSQLHFFIAKKLGDHSGMITSIENNIKKAANICERINNKTYTSEDISKLRSILRIYGCI
jgi:hypothetical protein